MDALNTEQSQTTRLNIDFSHHLSPLMEEKIDARTLSDTVDSMALRAISTLVLLGGQFSDEEVSKINDDAIYWVIESVINEVKDIQQIVRSHHEQARA
jgi:hypothetical protein